MNLKNFESIFDKKILQRGRDYYCNGAVLSLEQISDNEYTAEVDGSMIYDVFIEIDGNGDVTDIRCDCPYDMGEYCKHEAAVLFALRDRTKTNNKPSVRKSSLPELLGKCSKNQLIGIILEHTKDDKDFRNYLSMKLSECSDINSIISDFRRISNRFFNGNSDVDGVLKTAYFILDKIEKSKNDVEKVKAYSEIILMLESGLDNSCDYDEKGWELYDVINDCFTYTESAVKNIVRSKNMHDVALVWDCLLKKWHDKFLTDGEDSFFTSLLHLCEFPEYRQKLDELLSFQRYSANEYKKRKIDEQRFIIVKSYGTQKEISDYIDKHIDNPSFRRLAIQNAIDSKDYNRAEQLALDGETSDKKYKGLVYDWQCLRHDIYKLSGNTKKLADICRILVKDGETDYYEEWKSLLTEEKRAAEINRLLNEVRYYTYEYIVVQENMIDKIYELCCDSPHKICGYYHYLKDSCFASKGIILYEQYIRTEAEQASTRSEYASVCKYLKKFSSECNKDTAKSIAGDFKELYRRKPAFIDELKKAGFR